MSEGISYDWTVTGKGPGVEPLVKQLDLGHAAMSKLDGATKGHSSSLKEHAGHVEHASDAYKRHRYETEGLGKELREVKGRAHEFAEAIGIIAAAEVFKELAEGVIDLGKEIVGAAIKAERLETSLTFKLGGEGTESFLKAMDQLAPKTEFTGEQMKGWGDALLNAGFKAKDVIKVLAASSDVAALNGKDPMGGMERAIDAFRRLNEMGRISGRQLLGLNIPIEQFKLLDKFHGQSNEQIRKALEKGTIGKEELFQIIAGPDKTLGDMAEQMGKLLGAKLKNVKELPDKYFEKFSKSPVMDTMKDTLGGIFDALDPESERGGSVFKSLERSFTSVLGIVGNIDFEKVAGDLETKVLPEVELLFARVGEIHWADGAEELLKVLGLIKPIIDTIAQTMDGIKVGAKAAAALAEATNPAQLLKTGVHAILHPIDSIGELQRHEGGMGHLLDAGSGVIDFLKKPMYGYGADAGKSITDGIAKGVDAGVPGIEGAVEGAADAAQETMARKNESHSPSRVFERLGKDVGDGFVLGIKGSQGAIDDVVGGAFSIPASGGGRGGGGISAPITIEVNVDGSGQGAHDLGKTVADQIALVVPAALLRALEQVGAEMGSA